MGFQKWATILGDDLATGAEALLFASLGVVAEVPGLLQFHKNAHARPAPSMKKTFDFRYARADNGRKIYLIRPKSGIRTKQTILYLHGGGYVVEFFQEHWYFMGRLAEELGCTVIAPDYPVVPSGTYREVFGMIQPIYRTIIGKIHPKDVVVMGDSAGGGMSLALCQKLAQDGLPQPGQTILLSPWMDVSMTNPEIQQVRKKDRILHPKLKRFGFYYAGDTSVMNYLVSPLYGSFRGLGRITLFTGTSDILNPDARKWAKRAREAGFPLDYREKEGMPHVWMLFHEGALASGHVLKQYDRNGAHYAEETVQEILALLREPSGHS